MFKKSDEPKKDKPLWYQRTTLLSMLATGISLTLVVLHRSFSSNNVNGMMKHDKASAASPGSNPLLCDDSERYRSSRQTRIDDDNSQPSSPVQVPVHYTAYLYNSLYLTMHILKGNDVIVYERDPKENYLSTDECLLEKNVEEAIDDKPFKICVGPEIIDWRDDDEISYFSRYALSQPKSDGNRYNCHNFFSSKQYKMTQDIEPENNLACIQLQKLPPSPGS